MIHKALYIILLSLFILVGCQPKFNHEITILEIEDTLEFLAGDSLKGRLPGTPEDSVLTAYILQKLSQSGMVPVGESGTQEVIVESGFIITENNRLIIGEENPLIIEGKLLKVFGFSPTDTVTGEIMLAAELPKEKKNIFGNSILILPLPDDLPSAEYDAFSFLRSHSLAAYDMGAKALVYVYKEEFPVPGINKRQTLHILFLLLSWTN